MAAPSVRAAIRSRGTMTDAGAMWGSAPWERVAPTMAAIHDRLISALDPSPGERWLDVATGTGAVAARAARAGANVTGAGADERGHGTHTPVTQARPSDYVHPQLPSPLGLPPVARNCTAAPRSRPTTSRAWPIADARSRSEVGSSPCGISLLLHRRGGHETRTSARRRAESRAARRPRRRSRPTEGQAAAADFGHRQPPDPRRRRGPNGCEAAKPVWSAQAACSVGPDPLASKRVGRRSHAVGGVHPGAGLATELERQHE